MLRDIIDADGMARIASREFRVLLTWKRCGDQVDDGLYTEAQHIR
jgi:hypothetical protein